MFKLLPHHEKVRLQKEYRVRLAVVALFFLFSVEVVGIAALMPSFFLSKVKDDQIKNEQKVLGALMEEEKDPQLALELERAKNQIRQLVVDEETVEVAKLFGIVNKDRAPGISISSFDLDRKKEGEDELRIFGTASSRDALVLFNKTLETEELFTKVELPVSDLARNRDITFSIRIQGNF